MLIIEIIAILSCTIFSGAAIYINIAEHPARLECGAELAATVFGPSYRRAAAMQVFLALVAATAGGSMGMYSGNKLWFLGASLIFSVIPFTLIAIMPTNKKLLDLNRKRDSMETVGLLVKWGKLHAIRSLTSIIAAVIYIYLGIAT